MKNHSKRRWNKYYRHSNSTSVNHDDWLAKHVSLFNERETILEVGCGFGFNTQFLLSRNHDILSTDFSSEVLKKIRSSDTRIRTKKIDLSKRITLKKESFDTIIADLCLHYFDYKTTTRIIRDFNLLLKQSGKIFCRVNSIYDTNHDAGKGLEIEENYYYRNGLYKRFFDEKSIRVFFKNWNIISCENYDIIRHSDPKNVYEIVCKKKGIIK